MLPPRARRASTTVTDRHSKTARRRPAQPPLLRSRSAQRSIQRSPWSPSRAWRRSSAAASARRSSSRRWAASRRASARSTTSAALARPQVCRARVVLGAAARGLEPVAPERLDTHRGARVDGGGEAVSRSAAARARPPPPARRAPRPGGDRATSAARARSTAADEPRRPRPRRPRARREHGREGPLRSLLLGGAQRPGGSRAHWLRRRGHLNPSPLDMAIESGGVAILRSPTMSVSQHTTARRYRIERYLTEGGMGAIYIGKKLGPGGFEKEVVLKQLLPEYTVAQASRVPRPLLPRGEDLRDRLRPRQHRAHVRPRRVGRVAVHRHGVREGRRPADDRPPGPPATQGAVRRRRDPHRARRARGPRLRARAPRRQRRVAQHHSPRRLALEHPVLGAGRGEAVRLRHRQGLDALVGLLSRARQGRVHVARAGAQRARRSPLGSLLARRVPLRGAHGRAAVRRRSVDAARRHLRPAHRAAVAEAQEPARGARRGARARARAQARRSLSGRDGLHRGAASGGAPIRDGVLRAAARRAPPQHPRTRARALAARRGDGQRRRRHAEDPREGSSG